MHNIAIPATTQLGMDEEKLESLGALWTAREIQQQPAMLRETQALLFATKLKIENFLKPLFAKPVRIILTGAGTSAFIGQCLAPTLAAQSQMRIEAIPTTDIVSAPELYFEMETPTLLVSFARSGNSPESLAAVKLADHFVTDLHHLIITCNKDGALAQYAADNTRRFIILLPEKTHDQSFAMTSSFSCMTYAALAVISGIDSLQENRIAAIATATQSVLTDYLSLTQQIASEKYERIVYLGSHIFQGVARESSLKLLELTNGNMISLFDSSLGFRHGPKTIINNKTLVVIFFSNNAYTRKYDVDLFEELNKDKLAARIIAITAQDGIGGNTSNIIRIKGLENANDTDLLFPFIICPQILAFYEALRHHLMPDKPNTSGTVNRVVQGVHIHAFR
jgi:tagatose-6-phosphate ketose/aldose isomerase